MLTCTWGIFWFSVRMRLVLTVISSRSLVPRIGWIREDDGWVGGGFGDGGIGADAAAGDTTSGCRGGDGP